jgi:hypothetical protein
MIYLEIYIELQYTTTLAALWEESLMENWPLGIKSSASEPIGDNKGRQEKNL